MSNVYQIGYNFAKYFYEIVKFIAHKLYCYVIYLELLPLVIVNFTNLKIYTMKLNLTNSLRILCYLCCYL